MSLCENGSRAKAEVGQHFFRRALDIAIEPLLQSLRERGQVNKVAVENDRFILRAGDGICARRQRRFGAPSRDG